MSQNEVERGESGESLEACLHLSTEMRDEIVEHLRRALPEEGCGLIGVKALPSGAFESVRFFPGENVDRSRTRFTMDPAQVIAAFKEMRTTGLELGAIVHSHPAGAAVPSPTDVREAYYPDAVALIVSFAEGKPELRAWRWTGDEAGPAFRECRIVVSD